MALESTNDYVGQNLNEARPIFEPYVRYLQTIGRGSDLMPSLMPQLEEW